MKKSKKSKRPKRDERLKLEPSIPLSKMEIFMEDIYDPKGAPRFPAGTVIDKTSLVVDLDGNAWWVDPPHRSIWGA